MHSRVHSLKMYCERNIFNFSFFKYKGVSELSENCAVIRAGSEVTLIKMAQNGANWRLNLKDTTKNFAYSFTKEKSMAARHQGVVRFDWRWKLVIRRAVLKLQFKDFDRTKIDPLVYWQMSRHSFFITFSENHC